MKIYGDEASSQFKTYAQETGRIYGHNDVLLGDKQTFRRVTYSFFGDANEYVTVQPKLYLHICRNAWSSFTGKLKEYFLPWRWQVAYLDAENGTQPQRILVCTSTSQGKLSSRLNLLLGKSLFAANLINADYYDEIYDQEFLRVPEQNNQGKENRIVHPFGEWAGVYSEFASSSLCHIYRIKGIFSLLRYHFLKRFSKEWEEVALQAGQISKKVLIKRNDRAAISGLGLIH